MQRKYTSLMNRILVGLLSWVILTSAQAAEPLWTLSPALGSNPAQTVPANGTATVEYIVQNQTGKSKRLVIQAIPGIFQTGPCLLAPKGQAGSSCNLILAITGSALPIDGVHGGPSLCNPDRGPNPNQCYQPSMPNSLNITRGPMADATITVNPTTLVFAENSTGEVTVTNNAGSSVAAFNVAATIPGGSNISVQSTTCGTSLAIGASCTITFASSTQEGPTVIPIAGNNTNAVNVNVTVTSQPQISISSPIQQLRVVGVSATPLLLGVTNDAGSPVYANAITVSNKAACPNVSVLDGDCTNVAPGASCTLVLTSTTPYAPCTITVSGSNTNSTQTLIAFFYQGGLVFTESGGSGQIVIDQAQGFTSTWTGSAGITGATSFTDGFANTEAIIGSPTCSNDSFNCAAQLCRNISEDWYLPARDELSTVHGALCSNLTFPCNFGGFAGDSYWSSTQDTTGNDALAWNVLFPAGTIGESSKTIGFQVRCIRDFTS